MDKNHVRPLISVIFGQYSEWGALASNKVIMGNNAFQAVQGHHHYINCIHCSSYPRELGLISLGIYFGQNVMRSCRNDWPFRGYAVLVWIMNGSNNWMMRIWVIFVLADRRGYSFSSWTAFHLRFYPALQGFRQSAVSPWTFIDKTMKSWTGEELKEWGQHRI